MIGSAFSRRRLMQGAAAAAGYAALPRAAVAEAPGTVRLRSVVDVQTLDPAFTFSVHEHNINRAQLNNLITWKKHLAWEWELDAAAEVKQVDPTHVTFALRDDLGWSNGFGAMTADDVKFSFERIKDPALQSSYQSDWALLDHVEVTGERTGTIVMQKPQAALWGSTLPWVSGFILCRKAVEALEGKRVQTEMPAVSGPYAVKEWVPKQKLTMTRNDGWKGAKPDFDEIVFLPIDDDRAAELAYEAGELDYCNVAISSVPAYRQKLPAGSKFMEIPTLDYYWLGINCEHPSYADPRVRKAVQYALDVPAILDAAFYGVAQRATGYQAPGTIGHRDHNLIEARDLDKAKALLAEAGKAGGFKTTITLVNAAVWTSIAEVIQSNLADIGIQVEIKPYDSSAFWVLGLQDQGNAYKDIELYLQLFNGLPDPAFQTQWFVPEQIGVWNWERWNSPEYKALNDQQLGELDSKKRDELVRKMQDLMEDSGAYTFITNGLAGILHRDWLAPVTRPDGISLYLPGFTKAT